MTTLAFLLHPAYEPGDGSADGAQLVDGQWWHPQFGCDSLQYAVNNARQALAPAIATPGEQYHEDDGPVLWWRFPVVEAPWAGTPNDSDWPGCHTHYTPLPPAPVAPIQSPADSILSDRLALAACPRQRSGATPCLAPCIDCLAIAKAVAHEIADHFSELYGGASTTADTLYAVGCHEPDPLPAWRKRFTPGQEAAAIAIAREPQKPYG